MAKSRIFLPGRSCPFYGEIIGSSRANPLIGQDKTTSSEKYRGKTKKSLAFGILMIKFRSALWMFINNKQEKD